MSQLPRRPAGTHELEVELDGPLRVTVVVPEVVAAAPLVVSLHYAGEVTPFYGRGPVDKLFGPALADFAPVIVAPDARGGDWTTALNEAAVVRLTQMALAGFALDPRRVLLTGFSMGARGTWHVGPRHPGLFTAGLAVAGRPSPGPDWQVPFLVIHSRDDELIPVALTRQAAEEQAGRGAPVAFRELAGYTHRDTSTYLEPVREAAVPWLRRAWAMG